MTVPSSSPQHIGNIDEKERKVRETSVIVGLVSADGFTTADRTQLKTHSPEGPTNGQRRVNQEKEKDGGENGEAIPKMRILSTLTVDTGSRGATINTESQSWQPAFPHSFRNHDSGLDMT